MQTPATTIWAPAGAASINACRTPGPDAFEDHRPAEAPAHHADHLLGCAGLGDAQRLPAVVRRLLGRIDDDVGAQLLGGGAAAGRIVGGDHRPSALRLQRGDHGEADRPAAHHETDGGLVQPRLGDRVQADREGLGQRRLLGGEAIGHGQHQGLGEQHALGEAAGQAVGEAQRLHAARCQGHGHADHTGSGLQRLGRARAMVEDLGAELVAEDGVGGGIEAVVRASGAAREVDHVLHVVQRVQVGPADAAGQRPDQHLAVRRLQLGDLVADQLPVAPHYGSHLSLRSKSCWPIGRDRRRAEQSG
jgi:hypothetical protein